MAIYALGDIEPDIHPDAYVSALREYVDAGYTHVYFHQVGPDQAGFVEFASKHLLHAV